MAEEEDVAELTPEESRRIAGNGEFLVSLYRRWAPRGPQRRPNWEIYALGGLARCAYSFETIIGLAEKRELDAIGLTRSHFDHVVALAWLAIDPTRHYPMLLRSELTAREKMIAELAAFGAVTPGVSDAVRRAMVDAGHDSAPNVADMASKADSYWSRAEPRWKPWAFRRSYANLFRYCSAYVHPTVMGLAPFIEQHPDHVVVRSRPSLDDTVGDVRTYAVASFASAQIVVAHRLGGPPVTDILQIFTHGFVADAKDSDAS